MTAQKCSQRSPHYHPTEGYNDERGILAYQMNTSCEEQVFYDHARRFEFANGIPAYAPACECHRSILAEINHGGATVSNGVTGPKEVSATIICNETIVKETALLPLCFSCCCREQGLQPGQPPFPMDNCTCATHITFASCWYCEANRLEHTKQIAIQQRTVRIEGKDIIKCECGKFVRGPEGARRCVGCFGVVTSNVIGVHGHSFLAFPSISGPNIVFDGYTAKVRSSIVAPPRPARLPMDPEGQVQQMTPPPSSLRSDKHSMAHAATLETPDRTPSKHPASLTLLNRPSHQDEVNAGGTTKEISFHGEHVSGVPQRNLTVAPAAKTLQQTPIFTSQELREIRSLCLIYESKNDDVPHPLRPLKRAQWVLDQNSQTQISPSRIVRLFDICGVQKEEFGAVMVEACRLKTSSFPSGEDVSKAIAMKMGGAVD